MNLLKIAIVTVILAVCCSLNLADDEQQSQIPAAKRIALRRPVGKAAKPSTTTTTTPAPHADNDEGDYADDNQEHQYADEEEEQHSSTTTTTTEAPKKIGPVIRPFRSNNDFLNSLKRRQENAKKHRAEKIASKPVKTAQHVEADHGNNDNEDEPVAAPVATKSYKPSSLSSTRRKFSKPTKQDYAAPEDSADEPSETQQQKEEVKPKRTLGRLALRKTLTK